MSNLQPYSGLPDPMVLNQLREIQSLVQNIGGIRTLRQDWNRSGPDPRRDLDDECGYPKRGHLAPQLYQDLFDFNPYAARVVEVLSKECFQVTPRVYESDDNTVTDFEAAVDELPKQLRAEQSWYQDQEGSALWDYVQRADILSGVGHYGIILLGLDDAADLATPVKGVHEKNSIPVGRDRDGNPLPTVAANAQRLYGLTVNAAEIKGRKLSYLRVFPEYQAQIIQVESNFSSPRYGQPTMYLLTFNDPQQTYIAGVGLATTTRMVHWTRCVHIADVGHKATSSEVYASPRCEPVLRPLLDIAKVLGSSAEGYWQACFSLLSFETHPQLGGDVDVDVEGLKDVIEELRNGLQRHLLGRGGSWKTLSPTVADPTPHIAAHLEAICIKIGCPVRVFKGSERGELASSQDDKAWNDRLRERQTNYLTPRVIVPLFDRLIALGVLPQPAKGNKAKQETPGYSVDWPDVTSMSAQEKATVALTQTQAMSTYVSGGVEAVLPPATYLTEVMGFDDEKTQAILKEAEKHQEATMADHQARADAHGFEPKPPPGFAKPEPPQAPPAPIKLKEGERLVQPQSPNGQPQ